MAIKRKGKRKITVNDQEYLWWGFQERGQTEFDGAQVQVVPSNQKYFLNYGLVQTETERKVVLSLRDRAKLLHLRCQKFESEDGMISNSGIAGMINWCLQTDLEILYAVDGQDNMLDSDHQKTLLLELQGLLKND